MVRIGKAVSMPLLDHQSWSLSTAIPDAIDIESIHQRAA